MKLKTQKRLAAHVLGVSKKRAKFDPERLEDIKEAITKTDMRGLISEKAIRKISKKGTSKARTREAKKQRAKGLRKGPSTRKGTKSARVPRKGVWIKKIRNQREFLKELREKEKISKQTFVDLYKKSKGNFFRSRRHIMIYLKDHKLIENEKN